MISIFLEAFEMFGSYFENHKAKLREDFVRLLEHLPFV